ncbi:MAG TPA: PD-(D/E)XK nuclease family protein [Bacteroidales bacterium]|nr:PD-(D/E)XK nuclease family protein [Bacteroidales bacterium]
MDSFLDTITGLILKNYPDKTSSLCVVTPNRRAGFFLQKHFSKKVSKPIWAPEFLSIEDFINRISGYKVLDPISLLFEFYEVYSSFEKDKSDSFSDFMNWGNVLLRDFDEIEASLENPQNLYEYLNDAKRLENWNPDGTELTGFQKRHLAFFGKFSLWHTTLKEKLEARNEAFQGMSFSKAAHLVSTNKAYLPWHKVIFAGFNALNRSEECIIDKMLGDGLAEIYLDSDPFYENDNHHEAGHFIRKYRKKWNIPTLSTGNSGFNTPKKIRVFGIARNVAQAQLAGNLLDQCSEITHDLSTAVVLANENLLEPVLNAIPQKINSLNVTMGFPLKRTNLYGFYEALFQLQVSAGQFESLQGSNNHNFHYKDLIRFFSNPCTSLLWPEVGKNVLAETFLQKTGNSNRTFYNFGELELLFGKDSGFAEAFSFLSRNWSENVSDIVPELRKISKIIKNSIREKFACDPDILQVSSYLADYEGLFYVYSFLGNLETMLKKNQVIDHPASLWLILKQSLDDISIAFSGEPVEGLQVMGMLETRNLDFKNIIMLSVNEKILPKAKTFESFIPFDVKRKYGLLVHTDKDAIYAYHFYRLLQRAENIFLIYNTEPGGLGGSEKSRYITQLQFELKEKNAGIILTEQIVSLELGLTNKHSAISIEKTQDILERLSQMAETGLSVSSLNTFICCPLKFYFQKVARLDETREIEETIESSTMGSVIHGVLEDLYKPFEGKVLIADNVESMFSKVESYCLNHFSRHYPQGEITRGKNLLLATLAKYQINRFLHHQKELIAALSKENSHITVLNTETSLHGSIQIFVNGQPLKINIAGKADRIDRLEQTIRIIDYKTGHVDPNDLSLKSPDDLIEKKALDKVFQLLTYTWMYSQNQSENSIESGIYSLRNLKKGFMKVKTEMIDESGSDILKAYGNKLEELLGKIFDPNAPFDQTPDKDNCAFCPFAAVCGRFD